MKMFRALPPSTDVNPFDPVDGRDGAVDAADHHAQLGGQVIWEVLPVHRRADAVLEKSTSEGHLARRWDGRASWHLSRGTNRASGSLAVDAALTRARDVIGRWRLKGSGADVS